MITRRTEGFVYLAAFIACIPIANWMIGNVGTTCIPNGPCLVPVAPRLMAPSGVIMIGLALVLRDLVQRRLGRSWSLGAIAVGAILSGAVAPPALVVASATAFFFSELADFVVYTPLESRRFVTAVVASSMVGLVVDSVIFLWLAFNSLEFLWGQVIGKAWMVLISLPFIHWLRVRDSRTAQPLHTSAPVASAGNVMASRD
jgi:queuosine precursor transporter